MFAKLRKATIGFIMSVCPSAWIISAPTGQIFMKFGIWVSLKIYWENSSFIKVWQELQVLYMQTGIHFLSYLTHFALEWEIFQTKVVEKIKALFSENHAICKIMWKNIVEWGRPQVTVWRMCIACWIRKATNAHSEYLILIAFPLQQWLH